MGQQEDNEQKEKRYDESQDDVRSIRRQLDKLTAAVGDLIVALKGNEYGNDGLLKRVDNIETLADLLKTKVDDLAVKADKRANQLTTIAIMGGTFFGIFIKWLFELITTVKASGK